jgi:hypothetical protein
MKDQLVDVFSEIIAVYTENLTIQITTNTLCLNVRVFIMIQQVVHILTSVP